MDMRNRIQISIGIFGVEILQCVYERCRDNSIPTSVMQNDAQARGIICENLHTAYIDKIIYLKYAKDNWDRLYFIWSHEQQK